MCQRLPKTTSKYQNVFLYGVGAHLETETVILIVYFVDVLACKHYHIQHSHLENNPHLA